MAQRREVVSTNYPYLPIRVEVQGQSEEVLALIDTGYTGSVIIPVTLQGHDRGLDHSDGRFAVELGDGRTAFAPVYLGILGIIGFAAIYDVAVALLGNEYILGRRILERYEITLDHGQRVIVRL